jgi:hypothetical protein
MLQQQKFISLPIISMFLLGLLAIVFLVGRKHSSDSEPSGAISKHTQDTSSEDTLKYWTADKMRKAKPAKMPNLKKFGREKQQPGRPPRTANSHEAELK